MENKRSFLFASSFILKIVAIVSMTLDHVGYMFLASGYVGWWVTLFRIIGRLALPLYCFMIVEGVFHTRKPGMYFLRLGIMATGVTIALIVAETLKLGIRNEGNIFIDLLLGALMIYLLRRKEWYFKVIAILPIGLAFASYIATAMELCQNTLVYWFPYFLRLQYHVYSIILMLMFYVAYLLKDIFLSAWSNQSGIDVESLKGTNFERIAANLFAILMLVVVTLINYVVCMNLSNRWVFIDYSIQNYAMISGAFILLYSGKRGYNAKWFQYGCYLYYPLHMLLIFGIGALFM